MSRKNFTVATAEDGKTTLVKIEKTNVPTGKVTTLEDKKKRREAREQEYRNFRINALKRRAKRMNIPEDEIPKLVEKLKKQLDEPKNYTILVMYNPNDDKMITEMLTNNNLKYLFKSDSHLYIEGDATVLATIRELMPKSAKIHPYTKKAKPILEYTPPNKTVKSKHYSKAERKALAAKAKKLRKKKNIESFKNRVKRTGKLVAKKIKQERIKSRKATTVRLTNKKASESPKKASTGLKKAA